MKELSFETRGPFPYKELASSGCNKIIYGIHPSIFRSNRKGFKSPVEAWDDPILFNRALENRDRYKPEWRKLPIDKQRREIVHAFSVKYIAPVVTVFRIKRAAEIIKKFKKGFTFGTFKVFDPCAGFSGRALGAKEAGAIYEGWDINPVLVAEAEAAGIPIKLRNSLASEWPKSDVLFTCPPYGDLEQHHPDEDNLPFDDWMKIILDKSNSKTTIVVGPPSAKFSHLIADELNNIGAINGNGGKEVIYVR